MPIAEPSLSLKVVEHVPHAIHRVAKTYRSIQAQNHADNVIGRALATINRDRVGVAHHKRKKVTERRLRTNVGQHMWTIVAAMKELV